MQEYALGIAVAGAPHDQEFIPSNPSNSFNQPFLKESAGNVSEAYNVLGAISNTPALHEEAATRPLNANRGS